MPKHRRATCATRCSATSIVISIARCAERLPTGAARAAPLMNDWRPLDDLANRRDRLWRDRPGPYPQIDSHAVRRARRGRQRHRSAAGARCGDEVRARCRDLRRRP
ncbi:hypothetical protein EMIT0111MI5_40035 [Burkholderia sp. IT-111MI5]